MTKRIFQTVVVAVGYGSAAVAGPELASTVSGGASVGGPAADLVVTQTTDRALIEWNSFDIGPTESVTFRQPSADAIVLNRVIGSSDDAGPGGGLAATLIEGNLSGNGQVWIVNPNGILFGETSVVDVGGLLATTSDIDDADFDAGIFAFDRPPGSTGASVADVTNRGSITFADRGLAALVGARAANDGTIAGRLGSVVIAGRQTFTLSLGDDGLFAFDMGPSSPAAASATVAGSIVNDGGRVRIDAATAGAAVANAVSITGTVRANTVSERGGTIILSSDSGADVPGTLTARGDDATEAGGTIEIDVARATVSGTLDARAAGTGGTIEIETNPGETLRATGRFDASSTGGRGGRINLLGLGSLDANDGTFDVGGTVPGGLVQFTSRTIAVTDGVGPDGYSILTPATVQGTGGSVGIGAAIDVQVLSPIVIDGASLTIGGGDTVSVGADLTVTGGSLQIASDARVSESGGEDGAGLSDGIGSVRFVGDPVIDAGLFDLVTQAEVALPTTTSANAARIVARGTVTQAPGTTFTVREGGLVVETTGAIAFGNAGNAFTGPVSASGTTIALNAEGPLTLGSIAAGGDFSARATATIDDTPGRAIAVAGATTFSTTGDVVIDTVALHDFDSDDAGAGTVSVTAADATVRDVDDLRIGTLLVGDLTVQSGGALRFEAPVGTETPLGTVTVDGATDVTFAAPPPAGGGRTADSFTAQRLVFRDVTGAIVQTLDEGQQQTFADADSFFGVNVLEEDGFDYSAATPTALTVFGAIGDDRSGDAARRAVGASDAAFSFNTRQVTIPPAPPGGGDGDGGGDDGGGDGGDVATDPILVQVLRETTRQPEAVEQATIDPVSTDAPPALVERERRPLREVFSSLGNEELWRPAPIPTGEEETDR